MKRSQQRLLAGSSLLVIAALYLALGVFSGLWLRGLRLDLTENRLYTLTDGTRQLLSRIEEPINLYFFFSESAAGDLPPLRAYAARVREMLEEMAARSGGRLHLSVIDPQPFTEAEDRATAFGLRSVPVGATGQSLFFGLAGTNATDGQTMIPFFQPDKEAFLEYDLAKLISTLVDSKRPVVGLISGLNMGPGFDPASGRTSEGWVVDGELRQLFELRRLQEPVTAIAEDVDLLMLVHPKGLSEDALYAIDQFVLRGGRLLAFVDPQAEADPGAGGGDISSMMASRASDLGPLFKAWGLNFDPGKVVLDGKSALPVQPDPSQPPVRHLAILGLGQDELNQDDVVSADIAALNLSTAGSLSLSKDSTLSMEPLVQSSAESMLIDAEQVRFVPDPGLLLDGFKPGGERYVLAARLTGTLKTAFPDRKGEGRLAESAKPANLIVVADTDLLSDRMWVQVQDFFGQRIFNPFASNGDFVVNAVDNLVGSSELIQVRTRALAARPFERVEALKRSADERFRVKERELQNELAETERRLDELQTRRDDGGEVLLSPEQQAELERFQAEKLRIRGELRQVRANLDAEIKALGTRLKFVNIALVPLLVSVFAAGFAVWRSRRRRVRID